MDLTVAVGAASVEEEDRGGAPRGAGMARVDVTLRAESRIGNFEQPVVHRTVGLVAAGAVLNRRRMLPEKGPAPLRVAGIAVLVDACLLELGRIRTAVRIVAVGTG